MSQLKSELFVSHLPVHCAHLTTIFATFSKSTIKISRGYFQACNASFATTPSIAIDFSGTTRTTFGLFLKPSSFLNLKIFHFQNLKGSLFSP